MQDKPLLIQVKQSIKNNKKKCERSTRLFSNPGTKRKTDSSVKSGMMDCAIRTLKCYIKM